MEEKHEVFKKVLYRKGINYKKNRHLKIKQDKNRPYVLMFGENKVAICDKEEREEFLFEVVGSYSGKYNFYFETIKELTGQDIEYIENFCISEIILGKDSVCKVKNQYVIKEEGISELIKDKITIDEFYKELAKYIIREKKENKIMGCMYDMIINGLYVYDLTEKENEIWLIEKECWI